MPMVPSMPEISKKTMLCKSSNETVESGAFLIPLSKSGSKSLSRNHGKSTSSNEKIASMSSGPKAMQPMAQ